MSTGYLSVKENRTIIYSITIERNILLNLLQCISDMTLISRFIAVL